MQTEQNLTDQDRPAEKKETIKELADRHLKDEFHTTSDEELRNARIVLDEDVKVEDESLYEIDNTTLIPPIPAEESEDASNDIDDTSDDKDEDDRRLPNPYDVLR